MLIFCTSSLAFVESSYSFFFIHLYVCTFTVDLVNNQHWLSMGEQFRSLKYPFISPWSQLSFWPNLPWTPSTSKSKEVCTLTCHDWSRSHICQRILSYPILAQMTIQKPPQIWINSTLTIPPLYFYPTQIQLLGNDDARYLPLPFLFSSIVLDAAVPNSCHKSVIYLLYNE